MESQKPEVDQRGLDENDEKTDEELESMARKALECPCVAELRDGPCGSQFSEAFICYLKSTADEKGSDCVTSFLAMQACMEAKPENFSPKHEASDDENSDSDRFPRVRKPSSRRRSKSPPPPPGQKPSVSA